MEHYKNRREQQPFRAKLRRNLTPAEAALWNCLKGSQLDGRKFRRQYGLGKYVLDFYCPSERLAVELDGSTHFGVADVHYDNERRRFIEHFGIKVIRFDNKLVFKETVWVLDTIRAEFGWRDREG